MSGEQGLSFAWGLGVLVHGPCVLSRGPGVGVGLRCAFGYPDGLLLSTELKAVGEAAQDVDDVSFHPRSGRGGRGPRRVFRPHSALRFEVLEAGRPREVRVEHHLSAHHGRRDVGRGARDGETFTAATTVEVDWWLAGPWIAGPRHPRPGEDGTVTVRTGWPEVGLAVTTTVLTLTEPRYFDHAPVALR